MSLSGALNTALTGLQVNQNLIRLTSSNIANVDTEGYTKKVASLESIYIDGQGGGVDIASINRVVDNYIIEQINSQTSQVATAAGLDDFYTRIQDLFGAPSDSSSIAGRLNALQVSMEQLAVDPQQSVNQFTAVTSAVDVATNFNNISDTIQDLRQEVDKQIDSGVDKINLALDNLKTLNDGIVRAETIGSPAGDLYDKRDIELQKIAEQMNIKWFTRPNGAITIMTKDNYVLLDEKAYHLSFSSPSGVSKGTVYPGGFSNIDLKGIDLTSSITEGRIAAMVEMRDSVLVAFQDQIDQMATVTADNINRAHNSAMPIPGLKEFAGTTEFTVADLIDPTNPASIALDPYTDPTTATTEYGTLQFAIIDEEGNGVGDALRVNLDEFKTEMETYVSSITGLPYTYQVTVADIINMLNGAYAATPPAGSTVTPAPAGWPAAAPWPPSPALVMPSTGSDIGGLYNLSGASISGAYSGGNFARMSDGHLEIGLPSGSVYGLAIDDTSSTFADPNDTTRASTFNYLLKMNDLFVISPTAVSSGENISVRSDITDDPSKIGRAYLRSSERIPSDPTTEEWYVARGDGSGATAMADVFTARFNFTAQGQLPAALQSITEYGASIIQLSSTGAKNATDDYTFQKSLKTELENRFSETSGVSVDEELSRLVTIQNSYSASARIITTVNDMYDDLLSLLR